MYTGLRPGEKLFEERLMDEEGLERTKNELISIGKPLDFDEDVFLAYLLELGKAAYQDTDNIRNLVAEVVPSYSPAGRHGNEEKNAAYKKQLAEMESKKKQ